MVVRKPKIKLQFENTELKVLEIQGHIQCVLAKHKVNTNAILQVVSGEVDYIESTRSVNLKSGDYQLISPNVVHELRFISKSHLNLILMADSKIKFS